MILSSIQLDIIFLIRWITTGDLLVGVEIRSRRDLSGTPRRCHQSKLMNEALRLYGNLMIGLPFMRLLIHVLVESLRGLSHF